MRHTPQGYSGRYAPLEAQAIGQRVAARLAEYGQALRFIGHLHNRLNLSGLAIAQIVWMRPAPISTLITMAGAPSA